MVNLSDEKLRKQFLEVFVEAIQGIATQEEYKIFYHGTIFVLYLKVPQNKVTLTDQPNQGRVGYGRVRRGRVRVG